jgi:hypothetical protein
LVKARRENVAEDEEDEPEGGSDHEPVPKASSKKAKTE